MTAVADAYEPNAKSAGVYYSGRYWNDHPAVVDHLNQRATGDAATTWMDHLLAWRGRPFRHALILNCGNGWVERDLLQRGVIERATGIDFLEELLDAPRSIARDQGLPLEYARMDTNTADFPAGEYDLVVNHAAAHHIAHLDRVLRRVATMLPPDGVFVSWDYVGPHRNQYRASQWEAAFEVDRSLPERYRSGMHYPDLRLMLQSDPSEAVHSELFLETLRRYFVVDHDVRLGGAIAYLLLTHNTAMFDGPRDETAPLVERIIAADAAFVDSHPDETLFAYLIARPLPGALDDADQLARWTAEEDEREARAVANGGVYYPDTYVATIVRERNDLLERWPAAAPLPGESRLRAVVRAVPGASPAARMFRRVAARIRASYPLKRT